MPDILQYGRTRVIRLSDDSKIEIEFVIKAYTDEQHSISNQQIQNCNFSGVTDLFEDMLTQMLCDPICGEDHNTEDQDLDLDMEDEE